ncbi:LuxR C-terminal-related transcriptional regulator, partial [Klebsiella pneumoniae]|uniref:LuxR C-terminal-related transcriptional regulator n=1 Tax=Klebsiella pneumoniae TaxID=573 RepID=UPI001D18BCFD
VLYNSKRPHKSLELMTPVDYILRESKNCNMWWTHTASLSERELQIMLMITKGQKVNEISEQLNLSPKTVNSYRYRMFSKLNIHGDVELTHLAIRHGLCNAESLASQ